MSNQDDEVVYLSPYVAYFISRLLMLPPMAWTANGLLTQQAEALKEDPVTWHISKLAAVAGVSEDDLRLYLRLMKIRFQKQNRQGLFTDYYPDGNKDTLNTFMLIDFLKNAPMLDRKVLFVSRGKGLIFNRYLRQAPKQKVDLSSLRPYQFRCLWTFTSFDGVVDFYITSLDGKENYESLYDSINAFLCHNKFKADKYTFIIDRTLFEADERDLDSLEDYTPESFGGRVSFIYLPTYYEVYNPSFNINKIVLQPNVYAYRTESYFLDEIESLRPEFIKYAKVKRYHPDCLELIHQWVHLHKYVAEVNAFIKQYCDKLGFSADALNWASTIHKEENALDGLKDSVWFDPEDIQEDMQTPLPPEDFDFLDPNVIANPNLMIDQALKRVTPPPFDAAAAKARIEERKARESQAEEEADAAWDDSNDR